MNTALRWLLPPLVIGFSAVAVWQINQTEPPARKARPAAPLPLVEPLAAQPAQHTLKAQAYGSVIPADALRVRAQVSGQLQRLHRNFEPGGVVPAQALLLRIDPSDYRLAVESAQADIAAAKAELAIEAGKRKVAQEELQQLKGSLQLDEASRALALRTPQLNKLRAELLRANKRLEQAQLALARTELRLPYDLVVLSRALVSGELVNSGDVIGEVVRADRFWVSLQVSPKLLQRLQARSPQQAGSAVSVNANGVSYQAEVTRIVPQLNNDTRLAEVLVEIRDPLARLPENQQRPPLLLGTYVQASLESGTLDNVLAIPRSALQADNRLWLVDADNQLQIRQVQPLYIGPRYAYIEPLAEGERALPGNPGGLTPGSAVRVKDSSPNAQ